MKKKEYVGEKIDLAELLATDAEIYEPGESHEEYSLAEIFLSDFECDGFTDRSGRNAYSIQILLEADLIKDLIRVGHCHMCGQGSDDELKRFPCQSLEDEAEVVISKLIVQVNA